MRGCGSGNPSDTGSMIVVDGDSICCGVSSKLVLLCKALIQLGVVVKREESLLCKLPRVELVTIEPSRL